MTLISELQLSGRSTMATDLSEDDLQALRESIFVAQAPGQRCLVDQPSVQKVISSLHAELVQAGVLTESSVAIQAIAFDKTPGTNWKVTWHQDLMFPFARRVTADGFDLPTVKEGVDYARPPRAVLEDLLAVRLHLDDCDETNGPLRVSPGSHCHGILNASELSGMVDRQGTAICLPRTGEALLMRPLLIHASSIATAPKHRRVLHLVFHSGAPIAEAWHRAFKYKVETRSSSSSLTK